MTNANAKTNGTCCSSASTSAFAAWSDAMANLVKTSVETNKRIMEAWTKGLSPITTSPMTDAAVRMVGLVDGLTDIACRWTTDAAAIQVDQMKTLSRGFARGAEVFMGTKPVEPAKVAEETNAIVNDLTSACGRNAERMLRLGLDHANQCREVVDGAIAGKAN